MLSRRVVTPLWFSHRGDSFSGIFVLSPGLWLMKTSGSRGGGELPRCSQRAAFLMPSFWFLSDLGPGGTVRSTCSGGSRAALMYYWMHR